MYLEAIPKLCVRPSLAGGGGRSMALDATTWIGAKAESWAAAMISPTAMPQKAAARPSPANAASRLFTSKR